MSGNVKIWTMAVVVFFAVVGCGSSAAVVEASPSKPVVVTPVVQKAPTMITFSDNTFLVGTGPVVKGGYIIPPGTYATDGTGPVMGLCFYAVHGANGKIAQANFVYPADGITRVTVEAGQMFEVLNKCKWSIVVEVPV